MFKKIPKYLATSAFSTLEKKSSIHGLKVFHNFLGTSYKNEIQEKSVDLFQKILSNLHSAPGQQATTYLSQQHNLKTKEYYWLVKIANENELNSKPGIQSNVYGQHFKKYGEEGHTLTYFIGNQNLPEFIRTGLVNRVLEIPEVNELSEDSPLPLDWNFTFNTYAMAKDESSKLPGFDFHKDIPSNGAITMIYSIGARSEFQIRHPEKPSEAHAISLDSDSLILLSGPARWDYEHRVVPVKIEKNCPLIEIQNEAIMRISLVLGCSKVNRRN